MTWLLGALTFLHLSQSAETQLDSEGADGVSVLHEAECSSLSLLQTGLQVRGLHTGVHVAEEDTQRAQEDFNRHRASKAWWHFDKEFRGEHIKDPAFQLYGLNQNVSTRRPDGMFELSVMGDGKCYIKVPFEVAGGIDRHAKSFDSESLGKPAVWAEKPEFRGFIFGECPRVLPITFKNYLGTVMNPSLVRIPDKLKGFFPTGRWLVASNRELAVVDDRFEIIQQNNTFLRGVPHLKHFSKMRKREVYLDHEMLSDVRLFLMDDDAIAISFVPYELQFSKYALPSPRSWWFEQTFGILHVDAESDENGTRLNAWVDRKELRNLAKCPGEPERNFWQDGIKKNMNFMQRPGSSLYISDWVYPPSIGELDLKSPPKPSNGSFLGVACYGYPRPESLLDESVFGVNPPGTPTEKREQNALKQIKYNKPSGNGAPAVWIDEIQKFLGVAHFHRGYADSVKNVENKRRAAQFGHHYTHFFYTLSGEPPFKLTSMSNEWCFPSNADPQDCEVVQFVGGMQRDAEHVILTYGVMDWKGYVAKIDLATVLKSLRPVAQEKQ